MRASRVGAAVALGVPAVTWAAAHFSSPEVRAWRPGAGDRRIVAGLGVRQYGSGDDLVVLLSGLASSERFWGAAYDVLGHGARVVAIDPIGFGASMHSVAQQHLIDADAHVDGVLAVLRQLGLEAVPAVIVGHSMGASLALRVAARHAPIRAVVAFDAPLYLTHEEADDRVRHMGWFEALLAQGPFAERVCQWMCDNRAAARGIAVAISPRIPVAVARDAVQHTWHGYVAGFDALVRDPGWGAALRELEARSVVVRLVDGIDDPVPVPGRARELARTHANVAAICLPGGHRLPLSDPLGCAAVVLAALRESSARPSTPTSG